jgi:hypothetical protein
VHLDEETLSGIDVADAASLEKPEVVVHSGQNNCDVGSSALSTFSLIYSANKGVLPQEVSRPSLLDAAVFDSREGIA